MKAENLKVDGRTLRRGTALGTRIGKLAGSISAAARRNAIQLHEQNPAWAHIRLFSKVNETKRGCWEFTGCKNAEGYGHINLQGKVQLAHRVSFKIVNGYLTPGLLVCHKCDNPSCINPQHLFLGTNKENTMDAVKKGRRILVKNL